MTNAIIFYDAADEDIKMGLSVIWEVYNDNGYDKWFNGNDMLRLGITTMQPCDILFINCTLPMEMLLLLNHFGFKLKFFGNMYSPPISFSQTLLYDTCVIDSKSPISAILYGYYVYLQHSQSGNRMNFLPSKLVSDDLQHVYGNNLTELTTINLTNGTYIAGVNGMYLKQNIGSAMVLNDPIKARLLNFERCRGTTYV